jgi:hypothetical protein
MLRDRPTQSFSSVLAIVICIGGIASAWPTQTVGRQCESRWGVALKPTQSNRNGAATSKRQEAVSPEAVVRAFYKWYVHSLNHKIDPYQRQRATLRKYVTRRFLQQIADIIKKEGYLDADYFLAAQDWDAEWEKNVDVSGTQITGDTATTSVTLTGRESFIDKLKVKLKHEAGVWKIDQVDAIER